MQMCVRCVSARTDEVMAKHWSVNPLLAGHGAAAHCEIKQLLSSWCVFMHMDVTLPVSNTSLDQSGCCSHDADACIRSL